MVLIAQVALYVPTAQATGPQEEPSPQRTSGSSSTGIEIEMVEFPAAQLGSDITGNSPTRSSTDDVVLPMDMEKSTESNTSTSGSPKNTPDSTASSDLPENLRILLESMALEQNYRLSKKQTGAIVLPIVYATYSASKITALLFGRPFSDFFKTEYLWADDEGNVHGNNHAGRTTAGLIAPGVLGKFCRWVAEALTPTQVTPNNRRSWVKQVLHALYAPLYRDAQDVEQPGHTRSLVNKVMGCAALLVVFIKPLMIFFDVIKARANSDTSEREAIMLFIDLPFYTLFQFETLYAATQNVLDRVQTAPWGGLLSRLGIPLSQRVERETLMAKIQETLDQRIAAVATLDLETLNTIWPDPHGFVTPESLEPLLSSPHKIAETPAPSRSKTWGLRLSTIVGVLGSYASYKIGESLGQKALLTFNPEADLSTPNAQAFVQTTGVLMMTLKVAAQTLAPRRFFSFLYDRYTDAPTVADTTFPKIRKGVTTFAALIGGWQGMMTLFAGSAALNPVTVGEKIVMYGSLASAFYGDVATRGARSIQDHDALMNLVTNRPFVLDRTGDMMAQKRDWTKQVLSSLRSKVAHMNLELLHNLHGILNKNKDRQNSFV